MVLGSGLMASAFSAFATDDRYRVIAAGVSNSKERNAAAYAREQRMIEALPVDGGKVVYLGTCSIFDTALAGSPYLEHKRAMELLVHTRFADAMVLRLPNILGRSVNPHTLLNNFRDRILRGLPIDIQMGACRFVLDQRELVRVLPLLLGHTPFRGHSINICYDAPVPVHRLLALLEQVLDRKAVVQQVPGGACYPVVNTEFCGLLRTHGIAQPDEADLLRCVRDHYAQDAKQDTGSH